MFKLLDLFCGAGGCTKGYQEAGFEVDGVDLYPQKRYCGSRFFQTDALEFLAEHGHEYDAVSASPPCQKHTVLKSVWQNDPTYLERHVDMIPQTREALIANGKPYVIENVMGARRLLVEPIMLCGTMFGLKVYRHRVFEISVPISAPAHYPHKDSSPRSGRGKSPKGFISVTGNGGVASNHGASALGMPYLEYASMAMGIDWMSRKELSQAIPPTYTKYIGQRLLIYLQRQRYSAVNNFVRSIHMQMQGGKHESIFRS